ncbi:PREDICTED: LOW QUALITY PROTEIN: CDGSH iron-sulfur domain-containing protein 3, mitochondrial [Ceratotherium simum simum]|uniref:LOW QUALITY PROTEIN: CDGSH iron-sulfur domain-containing protein 3, mitochondrial n=1 Tax=Ceratotherium simum simum TaxID=73337 RepID=A0ABM0HVN2_CERSS|nr:PREDICTED: LOW QUALITY PROTEIN: CDGSH iron-sulfur domain-containing protein 3, mitochondrial [Ceratotherium simum simum]
MGALLRPAAWVSTPHPGAAALASSSPRRCPPPLPPKRRPLPLRRAPPGPRVAWCFAALPERLLVSIDFIFLLPNHRHMCLRALQKLNQRRDSSSWLARWFPKTPAKSVVAQKTPIKVELVAGKTYRWCVCGRSKKQPFCDGSHFFQHTGLSPLKFKAQETRTVALCTCKATQKPPYCDGTHRSERVQKAEVGSPL